MALLAEESSIRDTYEVETFLGEGAFAEVYRVRHKFLGRQALKLFKAPGWSPSEVVAMLGEAALLSKLNHPNIVRVYEANTLELGDDTFGYFTMEYVAGGSLFHYWQSFGSQFMPVQTVVEILKQVCKGIAIAHSQSPPIVHRDIKPQNILIGHEVSGIRAVVSDFGLAKKVNPLTMMATSRGTVSFKAPEALRDTQSDSPAGDVWALGTSLYLLLSDRLPFDVDEKDHVSISETFRKPLAPPSRWNALCDPELDRIVLKALQLNPQDRYSSAADFLSRLDSWTPRILNLAHDESRPPDRGTTSKSVLGSTPQQREHAARQLALRSIAIAQDSDRLPDAVALMEQALQDSPELSAEYQARLRLWRRGISM